MEKLISPQNKLIVRIQNKYIDKITTASGVILYLDTTFHPENQAMIEAEVIAIPESIMTRADYVAYTELPAVGDTILMRYDVVYAYRNQPDRATPIYKNMLWLRGDEYWMCDIQKVFAVKTADGYRMLNGYVFCDMVTEDRFENSIIETPLSVRTKVLDDKMIVRHIGPGEVQTGETIYCQPRVAQHYALNTDHFFIIKQSHILAVAM